MLKLIKLSLKGFGCFKEEKIFEYGDNINIIHAENGKGKSTSLQALELMLLSVSEFNYSDFMNRECNEFTVSLEFMLDKYHLLETLVCKKGKTYTATRNLKDLDTDQDLANGEGVKDWLEQYLPTATSKYALFVRQNSDMDIVHASDSERRDLFKKIQDLDYTKEIKTLIEPKIEQTKDKIIEVDKEIFAIENRNYESKNYVELPFTEEERSLKQTQLDKLNAEKALVEEKKNQLKDLEVRKTSLENEQVSVDSKIATKKVTLASNRQFNPDSEIERIEKEFANKKLECEDKIKSLEESKNNFDKESEDKSLELEAEIRKLEDEGNGLVKEIDSIRLVKLIKFDESKLTDARNDLSSLRTKSKIAWENASKLKSGICPVCGGSCTDKHAQFEDEAIGYDKQIAECEGVIDDLLAKKADIDEKAKRNDEQKEHKSNLQNELVRKQSLIENKRTQQKSLHDSLLQKKENCINQIASERRILEQLNSEKESKLNSVKEKADMYATQIQNLEGEIEELQRQSASKAQEITEIAEKIEAFSTGTFDGDKIEVLSAEIKSYDSAIAENKVVEEYNRQLEETKKADKKELEKFKEREQKFEKEKFNLESSKKILTSDYPNWYTLQNLNYLQSSINDFIEQVYYKLLNIKFEMGRNGNGIKMTYGADIPIKRTSGAEKAITNIGFCQSFNKNLGLNTILLDEPDAPLSKKITQIFYQSLLEMKDVFEQMVIVTHSNDMVNYIQANDTDCNIITL